MATQIRLVRPRTAELVLRGVRCLVGGPEQPGHGGGLGGGPRDDAVEQQISAFLEYGSSIALDPQCQVIAVEEPSGTDPTAPVSGGRAVGVCLWVPSPGCSAMLFTPSIQEFPPISDAVEACVTAALQDAAAAGVILVQAMLDPFDGPGAAMFAAAGLAKLTTLVYMERRVPLTPPLAPLPDGFRLVEYSAATHEIFARAILASYEQTLDCPALSGLRHIEDVIAGHKAVGGPGRFDPSLWHVVLAGDEPVGCLLLGEISARRSMEIVYIGLAPQARRRGLGRALIQHTLAEAQQRRCALATLAVDELNLPAMKLYRRFGYMAVQRRLAMIRKLGPIPPRAA